MAIALGAMALVVGSVGVGVGVGAAVASTPGAPAVAGLSDPTGNGHTYRHGALPLRASGARLHLAVAATTPRSTSPQAAGGAGGRAPLRYHGGPVVTGPPKVYLVFWGSQWGTQSTVGGYQHFSGDPSGVAPALQAFYSGLGGNGELWSAIVTQYCQGAASGARSCPLAPANHVAFPGAGVLANVWEDTSFTPPQSATPGDSSIGGATADQLAQEAADAAVHFGDSSANAQFVIVSPTRTNPDGWLDPHNGYCAYHDSTGDPAFGGSVTGPAVAYTNFPYVLDAGAQACASTGMVGLLDAVTETASHEYAETLTDPDAQSGWFDRHGSEIGDKCEYVTPGQPGAAFYLTLATGTFDVQGLWANDAGKGGGCADTHSAVLTASSGKQKTVVGTPVAVSLSAFDVRGEALTYTASGLPLGLSINPTSGLVTGAATTRGRSSVVVTAADTTSSSSVSFTWTVSKH